MNGWVLVVMICSSANAGPCDKHTEVMVSGIASEAACWEMLEHFQLTGVAKTAACYEQWVVVGGTP